jgi:hypothetical protein
LPHHTLALEALAWHWHGIGMAWLQHT